MIFLCWTHRAYTMYLGCVQCSASLSGPSTILLYSAPRQAAGCSHSGFTVSSAPLEHTAISCWWTHIMFFTFIEHTMLFTESALWAHLTNMYNTWGTVENTWWQNIMVWKYCILWYVFLIFIILRSDELNSITLCVKVSVIKNWVKCWHTGF